MTRLAIACYVLAVLALAQAYERGWPAAVVAVAALAASVAFHALDKRESKVLEAVAAQAACARAESEKSAEDVKRLRTELHATLERLKRPQGF